MATAPSRRHPSWSTPGAGPIAVALGDFNADGFLGAAAANMDILQRLRSSLATATAHSRMWFRRPPRETGRDSMAAGDFNGDGRLDVVTAGEPDITVLLQLPLPVAGVLPSVLNVRQSDLSSTSNSQPVTLSNTGGAALPSQASPPARTSARPTTVEPALRQAATGRSM